ncbi:sodium-dependent bicarbonate transport family permease [Pseudidiomarina gelatinasegens]|uniref:sodium-dependent bicarbonate transport family permease n=1 Tax=Pseudidiomarina gelatinasegens TaxID=2487740 RepID=UPI003A9710D3
MPDIVIAFFILGLIAGVVKSDLKVPGQIYEILSILLMLSIGIKGGLALHSEQQTIVWSHLAAIMLLGLVIPIILLPVLKKWVRLAHVDAISIAAHYGSVSAGTFAVAWALAESFNLPISADTTLYLVILELPAIIVMLALYHWKLGGEGKNTNMLAIWHEAFTSRGVILLMGGVALGWLYGPSGLSAIAPLVVDGFKVLLALFLLEMGLTTARICRPLPLEHWRLVVFAALAPLALVWPGLLLGSYLGLQPGSVLILAALTASASYIAAPAAIRAAIPDANISKAMLASLGVTFPLNVIVYIPFLATQL